MHDIVLDQCPELKAPNFGNVTMMKTSDIFTATYNCEKGYQLQGSSQRFCDPTSQRISEDGILSKWLPFVAPSCKGKVVFRKTY